MNQFVFILTQSNTPIIGPLAKIFGVIMDGIYEFFQSSFGIESLGLSIIVFTLIMRLLMLPLAVKQQKSMQGMQKVQPEIKKLQEKYKNKKDQESQRKMQMEMQQIYKNHNVSPFGGCLPLLIQFPVIFALFQVLRNIPAYITQVKDMYLGIVSQIITVPGYEKILSSFNENKKIRGFDTGVKDSIIDLLSKFSSNEWIAFKEQFASVQNQINPLIDKITDINSFFTINLSDTPINFNNGISGIFTLGLLIPILCLLAQILVTKTSSATTPSGDGAGAQTQKTMMYTMPIVTVIFVVQMPAGLGLYWLTSNVFQFIQQVVINKHLKEDKEKMVKQTKMNVNK